MSMIVPLASKQVVLCPICNKHSADPCNLHETISAGLGCRQNKEAGFYEHPDIDNLPPSGPSIGVFGLGDIVRKTGGDYVFDGVVVGVIKKLSGQIRYAVEDDRGILHIFNFKQLAILQPKETEHATQR